MQRRALCKARVGQRTGKGGARARGEGYRGRRGEAGRYLEA
jgi:hypothetical protein